MAVWPNLFIAGAPRCGTTSLHAWLHQIPGIWMSRIKEPNYFSRQAIADDDPLVKPIRDDARYLALFDGAGEARYRGEASPNYLEDPGAPAMILERSPDARVIVSLRDPVERLYSIYLMFRNNVSGLGSFAEEVERGLANAPGRRRKVLRADTGLYAAQVERYRRAFGHARFKILVFEDMIADVPAALRDVLQFLAIEHSVEGFSEPQQRQYGEARGPLVRFLFGNRLISRAAERFVPYRLRKQVRNRFLVKPAVKQEMEPETRAMLVRYYRDDVARLEEMLGRRLPWRNFARDLPSERAG